MIPDADIVALSGSVSNHWSRKSDALIVMSWTNTACWRSRQLLEPPGEPRQREEWPRIERRRVRRDDRQDRLDEAGHVDHQLAVFLVRLGVAGRPAAQLAHRPAVVVDSPQVVAAALGRALALAQRGERPVERQDVEAVLRELEVADDLRPQQRDDVREDAEAEAREQLLGHSGATEDWPLLEDQRLQAGAREVGRADQAVVAAADDHRVVALGQPAPSLSSLHTFHAAYPSDGRFRCAYSTP